MKRERNAKQAFIEGTVRVVARDGLDKTTTKAIATEAGLSEAYIYRCFESKEALLCAAFHMEDVAFAYFLKQNLVGMHIQNTPLNSLIRNTGEIYQALKFPRLFVWMNLAL